MNDPQRFFLATAPRGFADLLLRELQAIGAQEVHERGAAVGFSGSLEAGYQACLWSRIASRILLQLAQFQAASADDFYRAVRAIDWSEHIDPAGSIACEFTGTHPQINNTHFGTLRFKDAICDRLREDCGRRPDVKLSRPSVRLLAHANGTHVTVSLDLSGEGLHRRGYRSEAGEAPLRENLAAALLLRARWAEAAARGEQFLDPMCGSGTLVIEAAMIAAGRAPALLRDYFGFLGWRGHDAGLWSRLLTQAQRAVRSQAVNTIRGSDIDQRALIVAKANAERAGLSNWVHFEHQPVAQVKPEEVEPGLVCTNPPYGERLGSAEQAVALYGELGGVLRERFAGWDAAILSASAATTHALHLRSYRVHELMNGAIACRLLRIDLSAPGAADPAAARLEREQQVVDSPGAQMFANRMEKNFKRLSKLARRADVSCYRLYDADMPEYAFAIDQYVDQQTAAVHLHVQEYAAPADIDAEGAIRRRREALSVLPRVLSVDRERVHQRVRRRQSGAEQYQREQAASSERAAQSFQVTEGGLKFWVNLDEYLDTGLFLDHRLTRERLRAAASGVRFLNLFCYTASATVYAAAGSASTTLSLDLSNAYLDWAARNFELNGLPSARHRLERADCREWLRDAAGQYDLIFLDPPTFSNSKRMQGVLDVQRDHVELITHCMRLLAPNGLLVFSTNAQRFKIDSEQLGHWRVSDVSSQTLPFDFARNPNIHRCFELRHPPAR